MQFLLISKQKKHEWADDCYRAAVSVIFTQISAKQGIKQFKGRSTISVVKYYKQTHDMNTFGRVCPEDLTPKPKQETFREITLIKEKWSGKIK